MRLLEITEQHRRDFWGTYCCEACNTVEKNVLGYDDEHFHNNVAPHRVCKHCGESTASLQLQPQKVTPKYDAHTQV